MADNPNVVISAKMTDEELLKSIDATLNRSEAKFTQFATDINNILGKINFDGMSKKSKKASEEESGGYQAVLKSMKELDKQRLNGKISQADYIQGIKELRKELLSLSIQTDDVNKKIKTQGALLSGRQISSLKSGSISTTAIESFNIPQLNQAVTVLQNKINLGKNDLEQEKKLLNVLSRVNTVLSERNRLSKAISIKPVTTTTAEKVDVPKTININEINGLLSSSNVTLGKLKEAREDVDKYRQSLVEGSKELVSTNALWNSISNRIKESEKSLRQQQTISMKKELGTTIAMPTNTIDEANTKLKKLQDLKNRISSQDKPLLDSVQIQRVDTQISNLTNKIEKLKAKMATPVPISMGAVLGLPENSLNDITAKMRAIGELRGNYGKGAPEMAQLNKEYQRLSVVQREALSTGIQAERMNNKLATSFENLGRRVLFYTGLGALTGFVRQLYQIRGEYEMLERSMGALLGDFGKGTELFNQIQAQALKSPLSVIDLSTAAKQLVAYNFNLGEIADTTRRVADLSSALGVPIERLVYNLGQIKSKQVLDARDARDFANAGFAIVPMLAKMYTAQKRMGDSVVTTSQVYDMMTKKMVSYSDVMKVINQATDKGGMFFDYQSKQAETLKGQLSNLTDAWNLMLNDMGEDNQGVLTGTVSITRKMLANWREIKTILTGIIVTYGAVKAGQLILNNAIGQNVVGLNKEILANKSKVASDLLRIKMTRDLTEVEEESLRQTKVVSVADYASALATKNLTKEQLMLKFALASKNSIVRQAIISNNMLTATEIAQATAMGRFPAILRMISLGFKTLAASVGTFMSSMLPMLALTAVITVVAKLISKWKEHQQQLEEINKQYSELKDKVVDISVNFKIAAVGSNLDEMKTKLADLISFAKEEFNLDITINTDKLNTEEVTQKFTELRNQINLIMAKSQAFQENVTGKETKQLESAGKQIDKIYNNLLTINKDVSNTLIDNLQGVKLGVMSQQYVESIKQAQTAGESNIEYIKRMYEAYKGLGLVWDAMDISGEKLAVNMSRLGLSTDKVNTDNIKNLSASIEFAFSTVKNIVPKIQKELEKADAKTLDDKKALIDNWVKSAKLTEMQRQILYDEFKIEFSVSPAKDLTNQLEGWKLSIQNYLKENPLKLTDEKGVVTLSPVNVDALLNQEGKSLTSIQQQAKQDYDEAKAEYDALAGLKLQGLATDKDVSDQYLIMKEKEHISNVVGYNDKKDEEKQISKIAQSIKDEIGLIENLTGSYDKLTKAGMSNKDALSLLNDEYRDSIDIINTTLSKYGLPQFDLANFAGKDVSGQLAYLEELKKVMKTKGLDKIKPDAYKEVNTQIEKITVDAKTYDLNRVTEGLQNSLSNIKESYELGLEIEADPELGGLFSSMFGVDSSKLPQKANDAISQMIDAWNSAVDKYNVSNVESPLTKVDVMKTTPEQFNQMFNLNKDSGIAKSYKEVYDTIYDIAKNDAVKTIQAYNDLNYKLADNAGKIVIEKQKLQDLQVKYEEETNEKKKALLGLQIEDQERAIEDLKAEAMKLAPFYDQLFNDTYNQSAKTLQKYIDTAKKVTDSARKIITDSGETRYELSYEDEKGAKKKDIVSLEEYLRITKQIDTIQREVINSNPFKKISDDLEKNNIPEAIKDIATEAQKASDAVGELSNMFKALGVGEGTTNTLDNIAKGISGIATAGTGIAQIASGDVIGGITNVLKGATTVINMIGDSRESRINKALKESQNQVKDLQSAYSDLEYEMTTAMGNEEVAIKRLQIVNRQLQLQELERQLQLEESRKAKKRDDDAIRDLKGEISSLTNTISEDVDSITTDLLGITSVKDAAFTMVSSMIDSFKNGEDYMAIFNQSFDDMVDNMIAKAIYSSVIGDAFEKLTKSLEDRQNVRTHPIEDDIKDIESRREKVIQSFMDDYGIKRGEAEKKAEQFFKYSKQIEDKKKELEKASETTDEDIKFFQEGSDKLREDSKKKFDEKMALYGITQGQDKDSLALSGLQQGIQGITEETGGAIESYMNNLNGQVFKQGSILQEMLNISKASLGGQSQMLLQMQQSYQVQQAIQSILSGWSNGSGRAMRVEMI